MIRIGTVTFFSGDIQRANETFSEALDLFRKLENTKAMGIANNNLGNTMLTMYRTMKRIGADKMCDMSREQVIQKGIEYFKNAIDSGEEAIERINREEGWSTNYLVFMQQLSNRYFNRAIFLLTVRDDHPSPQEAESQGLMDLSTCKDMDREVVDNGDREGFKGDQDIHFELLLSRIQGVLMLLRLGYEDEWDLEDLFQDAEKELSRALRHPSQSLFLDIAPAGQMQRLENAHIDYFGLLGEKCEDEADKISNNLKAARLAIRMLVEDDYVIGEAAMLALKAVIDCLGNDTMDIVDLDVSDAQAKLFQYRQMIGEAIALQYSENMVRREAFKASNMGDFNMEW
eukprot:CAMPEP_0116852458 /NCGR_PEP_ID=MMETSP0418-20121206/17302_1 /TAXON_ID=1158023 /ORGANISM="Astrosyne radiata, Strain 13vi08-1A" /LENGTH=342 /DNA_ID=CAMNT_0004484619 /DNA_START=293 /DNA_END=1318 /DNA_ORIENTATION=+